MAVNTQQTREKCEINPRPTLARQHTLRRRGAVAPRAPGAYVRECVCVCTRGGRASGRGSDGAGGGVGGGKARERERGRAKGGVFRAPPRRRRRDHHPCHRRPRPGAADGPVNALIGRPSCSAEDPKWKRRWELTLPLHAPLPVAVPTESRTSPSPLPPPYCTRRRSLMHGVVMNGAL